MAGYDRMNGPAAGVSGAFGRLRNAAWPCWAETPGRNSRSSAVLQRPA